MNTHIVLSGEANFERLDGSRIKVRFPPAVDIVYIELSQVLGNELQKKS